MPTTETKQTEDYTLTEDESAMLAGISAEIISLQSEAQAVLRSIIRLRKLPPGAWSIEDGKLRRSE